MHPINEDQQANQYHAETRIACCASSLSSSGPWGSAAWSYGAGARIERWLSRHPDDLGAESNLAESYFTNGRFAEAESRVAALLAEDRLEPRTKIALRAVQIAALLAQEKTNAMAERLAELHAALAAQPEQLKGGWTFAGTNHFIAQHEILRKHAWLSELLTAVGAADQTTMLMVIEGAQASIKAVARD